MIQKVLEHLWMAISGDSDDKILLFNNNRPPESSRMLFWKNTLTKKKISYKEKDLINKVKCFTEKDNHEVWSVENFYSDLPKINIGWKSNN